jgi:hypothetical protein
MDLSGLTSVSEKGNSYNFYSNYDDGTGNTIQIGQTEDTLTPQNYASNQWPILILTDPQATSPTIDNNNILWVSLRVNDNDKPLLFNLNLGIGDSAFIDVFNDVSTWTSNFNYSFPNVTPDTSLNSDLQISDTKNNVLSDTVSNFANVAYYLKAYFYRRQTATVPPDKVLSSQQFYHAAFCPLDLPNILDSTISYSTVENPNLLLMDQPLQLLGTGGFTHTINQGVTWNDNKVLFFSKHSKQFLDSKKKFLPVLLEQKLTSFPKNADPIIRNLNILCRTYQKVNMSTKFNIISVNGYSTSSDKKKEIAVFLGISNAECALLKSYVSQGFRSIYLQLTSAPPFVNPQFDVNGNSLFEYQILLQGLSSSGKEVFTTPTSGFPQPGVPILVYSRDNLFFSSPDFSSSETVTSGPNRVEYYASSKNKTTGLIKVNDNIDLCLTAVRQPIHFYYNNVRITQFKTVLAYEMLKGQILGFHNYPARVILPPYPALPAVPDPPDEYPTATTNYVSSGVDAKQSYENAAHDVLTYGKGTDPDGHSFPLGYQVVYGRTAERDVMVFFDNTNFDNNGNPDTSFTHPIQIQYPDAGNPTVNIHWDYSGSQRRYANPAIAAALIAIMIEVNVNFVSMGASFIDGTAFPSQTHANGEAIDIAYQSTDISQRIINGMIKYGFKEIIVGDMQFASLTGLPHIIDNIIHIFMEEV